MNNIYKVDFNFSSRKNTNKPGAASLPANSTVELAHLKMILKNLQACQNFYCQHKNETMGVLISVKYNRVIAKSRRIGKLLQVKNGSIDEKIVGAKFSPDKKHIITYHIGIEDLKTSIKAIKDCIDFIEIVEKTDGVICQKHLNEIQNGKYDTLLEKKQLRKTTLSRIIVDSFFIEYLDVPKADERPKNEQTITTIFGVGIKINDLLLKSGVAPRQADILDDYTALLSSEDWAKLEKSFPYMIASSVSNILDVPQIDGGDQNEEGHFIQSPKNEPTIGVIDTHFDRTVYFSEWVEYHNETYDVFDITKKDMRHGTAVASIIVDGPRLNKSLDDGCGNFRVRLFGVMHSKLGSSIEIAKKIENIVSRNPDIHVWNLSLGSDEEVDKNYISYVASVLDKIQYERKDIIFVVAGTNIPNNKKAPLRIGSPADSINSVVVSSVSKNGKPADYSRDGIVLSFYNKPDAAYYGGTDDLNMLVWTSGKDGSNVQGTSYAAPWIARKMSYLIDIMGLSREVAKALLIDSAVKWNDEILIDDRKKIGYGVVPTRIEDILQSKEDEIKIVTSCEVNSYETRTDGIPVPIVDGKYPYIAKATACYFPSCHRSQGVDYTDTELDFKFGQVDKNGRVLSINDDKQYDDGVYTYEQDARRNFRKWDNVKHIIQRYKPRLKDKKAKTDLRWGISIKASDRIKSHEEPIRVGIIITLKELHKKNRINNFVRSCELQGLRIRELDIESIIRINESLENEIIIE